MIDRSNGWNAVADTFMTARSDVGADVVRRWAMELPCGSAIADVGCGSGVPIAQTLIDAGFQLHGIDASPRLVAAFRERFPCHPVACEAAEDSRFFDRKFDGIVAIGLLFLLPAGAQQRVLERMAAALMPGGAILFSAPAQRCEWTDTLTERRSLSLGTDGYARILEAEGLALRTSVTDEGGNHYLDFAPR